MKKVLLIGKTGQLGGEIIKDANAFGFEVFPFDKEELDITDALQVKKVLEKIKPDVVINTSAYNFVPICEENPLPALELNFLAVGNLARLCKEEDIIFVTYSTDYVFDGRKGVPYGEEDTPNPLQIYGISKLSGEYAALMAHAGGTYVIRTCVLYGGKSGSPQKGNFILNIIKEAENKEAMEVSSEQVISPTFAGDLSKATFRLLAAQAKPGIYHLINEGHCSRYEFTREIFKLAGIDKELKPINRMGIDGRMKRPMFSALKNTKAKALGIELPSWQEGVKSYIDFLEKNE